MTYLLLIVPALVIGYYLFSIILLLVEKDHLRGDLEPAAYQPEKWKSAYLDERSADAGKLGLMHGGDYHTGPHSSVGRGPMRLYVTESKTTVVALISARFSGLELKKTILRSRRADGSVIETNDSGGLVDITGGTEKIVLWAASLPDLLAAHEARLERETNVPALAAPSQAFAQYEQIEVERGQRMVDKQLAKWTDPSRSTIRRTFKGVMAMMKANKAQTSDIVKREQKRIALEKAKNKTP